MLELLKTATILGFATLGTGAALQGLYYLTNFYPPSVVFYFFTGFSAYLAIEALEHLSGHEILTEESHALPSSKAS